MRVIFSIVKIGRPVKIQSFDQQYFTGWRLTQHVQKQVVYHGICLIIFKRL
jgi:hypothetical protein